MLDRNSAPQYWSERAKKLGKTAVGYADKNLDTQNALYLERKQFIFKYVSRLQHTVDYGCGIGRYAEDFFGKYVGLDMTRDLLDIAIENNPDRMFLHLHQPFIDAAISLHLGSMQQFFTATVLQHCSDELVLEIFQSVKEHAAKNFIFCLYENSCQFEKPHVKGRYPERYRKFVQDAGFDIRQFDFHSHILKGEEHSMTRIEVS